MNHSTTEPSPALGTLVTAILGEDAPQVIARLTPMRGDVVRNRLADRAEWTLSELYHLANMIGVTPARLLSSVLAVQRGRDLGEVGRELVRAAQREVAA